MTIDNFTPVSLEPNKIDYRDTAIYNKCILFLYSSPHKPEDVQISSDNYITNLSFFSTSNIDENKIKNVFELENKSINILNEVISNIPQGSGQRDALYYFINWINNNIKYDQESINILQNRGYDIFKNSNDFFEYYTFPSSLASIVNQKALCIGYAKTLVYLCNNVGIEASIILGNVKQSDSYIGHSIAKVTINNQNAYFDLSTVWDYREGSSKAMNLETVKNIIEPIDYFEY